MILKRSVIILMISTLAAFPSRSFAECQNAISLNVGERVADCPRIGLSLEYDKQIRKELIEGDYNKQIIDQQKRIIDLKDLQIKQTSEQADLWRSEALREREALDKERNKTNWGFWGGLIGGVALTVLAGWAVGQASR